MRKLYLTILVLSCLLLSAAFTYGDPGKRTELQAQSLTITGVVQNVSCNGSSDGNINISVSWGTPPYSYSWSTGATTQDINGLSAGTYSVTVTDANGSATSSFTVSQPTALSISVTTTGANCSGNNGSASATASGGTPPYTYQWSTGGTGATENSMAAGVYYVTVTDAHGCTATQQVNININSNQPFTATFASTNVTCNGGSNGTATVNASLGGNTYLWSTGATTQTVTGLTAGWYTVTVTHPNTCSLTFSVYISQPNIISLSQSTIVNNVSCFNGNDGNASVIITGGTPPYIYSWNTNPVQTTQSISGLSAGTYIVSIVDNMGCTGSDTVVVTQPSPLSAAITSTVAPACNGGTDGQATVTASGGTAGYAYDWSTNPAQNNATATGLSAGQYSVTVTDANGCVATASVSLSSPGTMVGSVTATNVSCNGGNNGSATANITGGTGSYAYSWNTTPAQTTAAATGLTAGNYTVTVTDANYCLLALPVTITDPPLLSSNIDAIVNVSCHGYESGSATVNVAGGTPGYQYSWSTNPAQTTATASGLPAGNYTVVVTDMNNCTTTGTVSITEPPLLTVSVTSSDALCNGAATGSATANAGGGTAPYSYSWNTNPAQTAATASGLTAGNYMVTVTDANGCTASSAASVSEPPALSATVSTVNASCNGNNDGSATVNVTGGTAGYTYSWSTNPVQTASTVTGLAAGTYTVTVTDANNCQVTSAAVITEPVMLTASVSSVTNVFCNGDSNGEATISAAGGTQPYSYSWAPAGGSGSSASGLAAGTYTVTVRDAQNCFTTVQVNISQPQPLSLATTSGSYNGYGVSCNGSSNGSATVNVTGGTPSYSCAWSGPNGFSSAAFAINNIGAGTYSVTVTDSNGCSAAANITLNAPPALSSAVSAATVAGGFNIGCNGNSTGSIDLSVTGGVPSYSFSWTGPNGYTASTEDVSNLPAGNYSVSITDINGCTSSSSITLAEPATLNVTTVSSSYSGGYNISCNGTATGSINATVSGGTTGYTYSWTGPNGFTAATASINNLYAGSYTLSVTDANGCTTGATVVLTEPQPVQLTSTLSQFSTGNISCNGYNDGSIDLGVTGGSAGYTFTWTGPNGFTASTEDVSSLYAGSYQVTATDANGCTASASIMLTEPAGLTTSATSQMPSCYGSSNGMIDVTTSGGAAPYTFLWSNGGNTEDITGIGAGSYTLTITDANGCNSTLTVSMTQPAGMIASSTVTGASCTSASNGSVDVSVNGGTAPYTYAWSNGATTQDLQGVSGSSYSATITDANGCTTQVSATVPVMYEVSLAYAATQVTCNGDNSGAIDISLLQGTSPCTYAWSTGGSSEDVSGLTAGVYSVTVTDANGCSGAQTITINQPGMLSADVTSPVSASGYNLSGYQSHDGTADLTVNGGTPPYTYAWSNGATTEDISGLAAGTYTVTITDANGCSVTASITLEQPIVLEMPTGYSPNGDGVNDYFVVHGIEAYPDNTIVVFNRWGNKVYEKNNYANEWDGRNSSGEQLPDGTYFVILKINSTDITLSGYVDLRRE